MMKKNCMFSLWRYLFGSVVLLCSLWTNVTHAQWAEQTISLHPGWNAVFLEVDPQDPAPEVVFAGIPVESVWMWNPQTSFVEYIQNPDELVPDDPEWLPGFHRIRRNPILRT